MWGRVCDGCNDRQLRVTRGGADGIAGRAGWDVEERGLYGAPELSVVVGDEVHVSVLKPLAMLGLGRSRVTRVPADEQGRMRADAVPALERADHRVHPGRQREYRSVRSGGGDLRGGAPGGRVGACGRRVRLVGGGSAYAAAFVRGILAADSWAVDCHKWLNVPYDSGLAIVREPKHLQRAMTLSAAYLPSGTIREPCSFTPEASRRARGVEIWAALRSLGRIGVSRDGRAEL